MGWLAGFEAGNPRPNGAAFGGSMNGFVGVNRVSGSPRRLHSNVTRRGGQYTKLTISRVRREREVVEGRILANLEFVAEDPESVFWELYAAWAPK